MKRILLLVIPLLLLGGVAFAFSQNNSNNDQGASENSQTSDTSQSSEFSGDTSQNGENNTSESSNSDDENPEESNSVQIVDFKFTPATITVKAGTIVTWTNQDTVRHNVVPDEENESFKKSELLAKGESYSNTFDEPGTYTYYCGPHPNMKGSVIVTE